MVDIIDVLGEVVSIRKQFIKTKTQIEYEINLSVGNNIYSISISDRLFRISDINLDTQFIFDVVWDFKVAGYLPCNSTPYVIKRLINIDNVDGIYLNIPGIEKIARHEIINLDLSEEEQFKRELSYDLQLLDQIEFYKMIKESSTDLSLITFVDYDVNIPITIFYEILQALKSNDGYVEFLYS